MSVVCEGTPTQPSIADLLEWLADLERIHSEVYPYFYTFYTFLYIVLYIFRDCPLPTINGG